MSKAIGILGGMGPMATVDLFEKIVRHTPAAIDQDHIRILINNNPKIPSRVAAIMKGSEDPLPELVRSAKVLEEAGADFIIMPCHTAHCWLEQLQSEMNIPVYSMIENTANYVERQGRHISDRILLLGTKATIQKELYQQEFRKRGLGFHIPNPQEQEVVSSAIEQVKASFTECNAFLEPLNLMLNRYYQKEITSVLAVCTEIPLLFPYLDPKFEKWDPTLMLAQMAISLARQVDDKVGGKP